MMTIATSGAFRLRLLALLAMWAVCFVAFDASAHDIPADVTVQAYVRPSGERLQLLVRVPLKAMRDVDYPRRPSGALDVARASAALREAAALWIADNVRLYENDQPLAAPRIVETRLSLESDRSFATFDGALAHLAAPALPATSELFWEQLLMDALLEYPIASAHSEFSIHPRLEKLGIRTRTVLRYVLPDGAVRVFEYHGDEGIVRLDPRWHHAALRFVESGFLHILSGADHLLFLLCLVIPFRRIVPLAVIVTGFTVAHSITLIASAFGLGPDALWFPPLIETLIAISILYVALENIIGAKVERRWVIAFMLGLVHGFAFSFQLKQELQFAGEHLLTALFAFNAGVEVGQLLVLVLVVPVLNALFRIVPERMGTIIVSAFVIHTAWHWLTERGEQLMRFPLPTLDAAALASLTRWAFVLVAVVALGWLVNVVRQNRTHVADATRTISNREARSDEHAH